ncbi:MAG: hypothetical protein WCY19_00600 [Candidatus Gastranaerophilaceae bacterium]
MRIDNQNYGNRNVNFKMNFPVKVAGKVQTRCGVRIRQAILDENISGAIRSLVRLLEGRQQMEKADKEAFLRMFNNIPDYEMPEKPVKACSLVRYYSKNGDAYLFTGKDAKIVNEIGKKFGPAKQTTKTLDVALLGEKYGNAISNLISNTSRQLKIMLKKGEKREPVELHIYADCLPRKLKNGELRYDFKIYKLSFEKIGTPLELDKNTAPILKPEKKEPIKSLKRKTPRKTNDPLQTKMNFFATV